MRIIVTDFDVDTFVSAKRQTSTDGFGGSFGTYADELDVLDLGLVLLSKSDRLFDGFRKRDVVSFKAEVRQDTVSGPYLSHRMDS